MCRRYTNITRVILTRVIFNPGQNGASVDAAYMIHIEEVRKAVKQMRCNKASGGDGIPAEVYKHGGTALVRHMHRLFLR